MILKRKKDVTVNYFGSLPTVHIYARYKEGKFYDLHTDKEIVLTNGSITKMVTLLANVRDEEYPKFAEEQRNEVLPAGTILFILMPMANQGQYTFVVKILSPLIMKKTGNKDAIVEPCKCKVINRIESGYIMDSIKFEPFEADSLNQVFFQASVKYRPKNKSHATNIYQNCLTEDGRKLSNFRF